ncbi:hypothetical protein BDZ97DRAFT_1757317 [Flammula alnicola]|nr:hypothetical protein BDZ97DRAFT_1757317 [Flammula alnicola]
MSQPKTTPTAKGRTAELPFAPLDFFLSSVRDPHNPTHCGICINGAFVECMVTERDVPLNQGALRKSPAVNQSPELWGAVVRFLLLPRTDEQLDRLLILLSTCSCQVVNPHIIGYHMKGLKQAEQSMSRAHMYTQEAGTGRDKATFSLGRCALIVNLFCVLGFFIGPKGLTSVTKGLTKPWPSRFTDLMPHGTDSFVQTMLQWYRFVPDTVICQVTAEVLRLNKSFLIPSLVKYRFLDTVVNSTRRLVDLTLVDIRSDDKAVRGGAARRFCYGALDFYRYFHCVRLQRPKYQEELLRGFETKIVQLCSILVYLSSDPNMPNLGSNNNPTQEDIYEDLAFYAQDLFRNSYMHLYPHPDIPVHPKIKAFDGPNFAGSPWCSPARGCAFCVWSMRRLVITIIGLLCDGTLCSAYGCRHSIIPGFGKNLQPSTRCRTMPFCGRECEARAWMDDTYPHQRVCTIVRSLVDRGGGSALFSAAVNGPTKQAEAIIEHILKRWEQAGVNQDDFQLVYDWDNLIMEGREDHRPEGNVLLPGYDDYDKIITLLSSGGRGLKAEYIDRLARWPSEVIREASLLKEQPFWNQDIDC